MSFEARLALGTPLPHVRARPAAPISEACRRGWAFWSRRHSVEGAAREAVEAAVRGMAGPNAVAQRQKVDRVRRAPHRSCTVRRAWTDERELREQADGDGRRRSRVERLLSQAPRWRDAKEKTLSSWRTARPWRCRARRSAIGRSRPVLFTRTCSAQRDTEVARFGSTRVRASLCQESGGEGRLQFCRRLVLFDLPGSHRLLSGSAGSIGLAAASGGDW